LISCCLSLFFDLLVGEPPARLHPTVWMGRMASLLEKILYAKTGFPAKIAGVLLVFLMLAFWGGIGWALQSLICKFIPNPLLATLALSAAASLTISLRSLQEHVLPVLRQLVSFHICEARKRLSMLVGRDTATLSRQEISRASVETLAESLGDGIISPLFFFAVFGLPGAFVYRAANTLDSMIGHKDEKYLCFGWAAARFDDLLNYLPARLFAIPCICLAALLVRANAGAAASTGFREHSRHKSPNAGWYEAAFAGACGIRLGGTNYYEGEKSEYPILNFPARKARPKNILTASRLVIVASIAVAAVLDLLRYLLF